MPALNTKRKQPKTNRTIETTTTKKKSSPKQTLQRNIAMFSRWLHIYVSMVSFAIVFFFSVTGITLNHPDTFAGALKNSQEKGKLNLQWVSSKDTNQINKLNIVEYLRKTHNIKAAVSEFRIDDSQCSVSFKGPGYAADVFINRENGSYDIMFIRAGVVGVLNDLHKGRDTGSRWSWMIDISAGLMVIVSLSGMILMLYIKRKRLSGLILAVLGLILFYLIYLIWI
ncbi:MAG: PepSY-associated TM helix domain-containing protein [Sediminibacterium sp.]